MTETLPRLREIAARHTTGLQEPTAIPRVAISKGVATSEPVSGLYTPLMALVLQGAKEVTNGGCGTILPATSSPRWSYPPPAAWCMRLPMSLTLR